MKGDPGGTGRIMDKGLARVCCPQCGKDYLLPFHARQDFFVLPVLKKRMLIWAQWIKANVLEDVAHRQYRLFYKDRKLLGQLAKCAKDTVAEIFSSIYPDYKPGIVLSIQTFGDLLLWHPHIHCLITEGVFNKDYNFHPIPKVDIKKAVIIFQEKVFDMLKRNARKMLLLKSRVLYLLIK